MIFRFILHLASLKGGNYPLDDARIRFCLNTLVNSNRGISWQSFELIFQYKYILNRYFRLKGARLEWSVRTDTPSTAAYRPSLWRASRTKARQCRPRPAHDHKQ